MLKHLALATLRGLLAVAAFYLLLSVANYVEHLT